MTRQLKKIDHMKYLVSNKNNLSYWYPKIQNIKGVRTPETIIIPFDFRSYWKVLDGQPLPEQAEKDFQKYYAAAEKLGYPVFMRTSQSSDKHSWKNTCYVESKEKLRKNLFNQIEHDAICDLFPNAVVFRKFIPMESYFTAWHGNFPVNKEIRCFINEGRLECYHPYWFEDAIKQAEQYGAVSDPNWRDRLPLITEFSKDDMAEIIGMLEKILPRFGKEWWSVDFAKSKRGKWYLIDMALGPVSYHYEGCKFKPKFM